MQPSHPIEHVLDRQPRWLDPPSDSDGDGDGDGWATDSSVEAQLRLGYDTL